MTPDTADDAPGPNSPDRRKTAPHSTRLTHREEQAILDALAQALAGPLDGYDEGSEEEDSARTAMESAQHKLWQRQTQR